VERHQHAKCRQNLSILTYFRFFKTAAAAILDFQICEILLADSVWKAQMHHCTKFRQYWSFRCGAIAIFRISTRGSAIAEGPRDALVIRNPATTKIPFENDCNPQMTLKTIHLRSSQLLLLHRHISHLVSGLFLQWLFLAPFLRYYHFWSRHDWRWPWELLYFSQ